MDDVLQDIQVPKEDAVAIDALLNDCSTLDEVIDKISEWSALPGQLVHWILMGAKCPDPLPPCFFTETVKWTEFLTPSNAGKRLLAAVLIYHRRFQTIGSFIDACVTDVFDIYTACLDLLGVNDAKIIANYLWESRSLYEPLFNEGDASMKRFMQDPEIPQEQKIKFANRLIPGRAMFICVSNGLLSVLKSDITSVEAASRIRMLPFLLLPENFEGKLPLISRRYPANVATVEQEKDLLQQWNRATDFCRKMQMPIATGVNFTNFILLRRTWSLLQDPGEYLTQCVSSNGSLPCKIEDLLCNSASPVVEEVEEGETVDERHMSQSADILTRRFREIEQLGTFLQKRAKCRDPRRRINNLALELIPYHTLPAGFIELFSNLPQLSSIIAANILCGLKINFQWIYGSEPTDISLLSNWSANVSVSAIHSYKRAIQSLLPCLTVELFEECREIIGIEMKGLTSKFDKVVVPQAPNTDVVLPEVPNLPLDLESKAERQTECAAGFKLLADCLDRINAISETSVDALRDTSVEPVDLVAWRPFAFVDSPLPDNYTSLSHEERLTQRWIDIRERQALDNEEANEVEESERYLSSQLNCWRALRANAFAGQYPSVPYPTGEGIGIASLLTMYS